MHWPISLRTDKRYVVISEILSKAFENEMVGYPSYEYAYTYLKQMKIGYKPTYPNPFEGTTPWKWGN